jgi:hypothetical protein
LRIAAVITIAACLWFFFRKMHWAKLGEALRDARVWPLVLAAILNFVCLWGKAVCWRIMLAPRYTVKVVRLFRYTIAAFAASVIAPARAGEVLRVWALKRRDGVPVAESAAVAVAEKLLDGISMLILIAPVPWLVPGLPSWVTRSMLLFGGIAVVVFVALVFVVGRIKVRAESSWFMRFLSGMHVLRSPKRLLLALLSLVVAWAADLAMVTLVLYAVGIDLPIGAGLLILFTLNVTIMVPSTPASVGALELGVLAATRLLHVPDEPALAFALLYHALQILPLVLAGFVLELRLVLGRDDRGDAVTLGGPILPTARAQR